MCAPWSQRPYFFCQLQKKKDWSGYTRLCVPLKTALQRKSNKSLGTGTHKIHTQN